MASLLRLACCLWSAAVAAERICGYEATVRAFDHTSPISVSGPSTTLDVKMTSLGVASASAEAPESLDIRSPSCIARNCPVYLSGENLDGLVASETVRSLSQS